MKEVVVVSAVRTPIGKFLGSLASVPAPRLGAAAITAAVERAGVNPDQIQHVYFGNVLQAGIGQAPARQAALYGGLPKSTGAVTVNKVCGSGMRALMDASNAIRVGEWDIAIAGGMESMSNAPFVLQGHRQGHKMGNGQLVDLMINDGLWDPYGDKHMGNCAELCAAKYGFSREDQDAFALQSYERAQAAVKDGRFNDELVRVEIPQRKGDAVVVSEDEEPFGAPLEKMGKLKPAFDRDAGTITAANASKLNDGASALVVMSAEKAKELGLEPIARVVSQGSFAQEPEWFTTAPAAAMKQAIDRSGLSQNDITRWEINEAFANVTMAATRELELDPEQVNVHGGAVALGHPIGASGARIVTTLLHAMVQDGQRYGCAGICIGGGEGTSVIFENLKV
ncbi:MAG: acetyl-CoA C-acetyltransferase [Myxococcota bacterium]